MLVYENGRIFGTIGGGSFEKQVIQDALSVIREKESRIFTHALVHDHGMCCGGSLKVFIEPIMTQKRLYIFGAGHIGKALAKFSHALGFNVTLIDEREDAFDDWQHEGIRLIRSSHSLAFEELTFDEHTFIAAITHDHAYDREIVAYCAKQPHAYLGMIGSKRKIALAKKTYQAGKILSEADMKGIDWPMGIPIQVQTPEEIAISILAKMIDTRSGLDRQY